MTPLHQAIRTQFEWPFAFFRARGILKPMKQRLQTLVGHWSAREWRAALALFASYLLVHALASYVLPPGARFNPASAIALSTLYFAGRRLWPVVYIAALVANILGGSSIWAIAFLPVFEVLQAVAGSWILYAAHIDPLFRRYRDTFYFLATIVVISLITPTLSALVRIARHLPDVISIWWHSYIAMLFCFLVVTPFLLRWFTKPRFSRTPIEIAELFGVFAVLLALDVLIFIRQIPTFFGIPLVDILLVPLFWIALKLRPRFITLALLLTSIIAIASISIKTPPALVISYLFQTELYLITLGVAFFIITSLEEDRRVNTNIMHSQMATLRNAVARESSESQAKNDFIAILSHELRNPLAPVLSSIDLLKLKGPRDEEDAELLHIMEDRMDTVRRLLDDLLDISRISEGKVALKKEPVALDAAIKRAVLSTEHHRKELHQRLILKLPAKTPHVVGDPVRLEQVFSNLLTNASKYSASGETITLSLHEQGTTVEIEVADRGIGLKPQELETIFLPFHQVTEDDRKKGLGIGLTLVRNFVELHGGTIEAHSEGLGLGSRFVVRLPTVKSDAPIPAKPPKEKSDIVKNGTSRGPLVLIIDDNDAAAGGVGRLLEFHGCRVAYAYEGGQGIQKARNITPDVIFLDIGLPDQDGHDVARLLRMEGYSGKLIALTGYGMNTSPDKDPKKYFDHYLVKPVSLTDLQRVLSGVL
jgi:signal transduction histidine kinase